MTLTKLKNVAKIGLDVALNFSLALLNRTSINKKKIKLGTNMAKSHILTLQKINKKKIKINTNKHTRKEIDQIFPLTKE